MNHISNKKPLWPQKKLNSKIQKWMRNRFLLWRGAFCLHHTLSKTLTSEKTWCTAKHLCVFEKMGKKNFTHTHWHMPAWASCFNSLMRTGISDSPPPKFDITSVKTHTFHNCHSCLFDTFSPRRYSTWASSCLARTEQPLYFWAVHIHLRGSNELCVNRRQWIKRSPECCLKENKQQKRGRKQWYCMCKHWRWERTVLLCWIHTVQLAIWRCRNNRALRTFL